MRSGFLPKIGQKHGAGQDVNLPFGKCAAVFYILPGTMFLTNLCYTLISRSRPILAKI